MNDKPLKGFKTKMSPIKLFFITLLVPFFGHADQRFIARCESIFSAPERYTDSRLQGHEIVQWRSRIANHLRLPVREISHKNFDGLSDALKKLSPQERADLLKTLTPLYREVSFNKYNDRQYSHLKRVMDLLISRLLAPKEFFEAQLALGKNPVEIYDAYLQQSLAATGLMQKYNAHDVLHLLRWVQIEIYSHSKTDYDANTWRMVFYGSYFNGRAILPISDIDTIAASKSQDRFLQNLNDKFFFKRQPLDHISSNSMDKFTINNAAQINPIVFIVSKDSLEMRVYPEVRIDELKTTSTREAPLIFTLDASKYTW